MGIDPVEGRLGLHLVHRARQGVRGAEQDREDLGDVGGAPAGEVVAVIVVVPLAVQGRLLEVGEELDPEVRAPAEAAPLRVDGDEPRGEVSPRVVVVMGREGQLLQVVGAAGAAGRLAGRLHGGQEQPDQDRDDGNHDQHLDQGEGIAAVVSGRARAWPSGDFVPRAGMLRAMGPRTLHAGRLGRRRGLPDPGRPIPAGRGDELPVRAERHAADPVQVAPQGVDLLGGPLPHLDGGIARPPGQGPAIGAEGDPLGRGPVSRIIRTCFQVAVSQIRTARSQPTEARNRPSGLNATP